MWFADVEGVEGNGVKRGWVLARLFRVFWSRALEISWWGAISLFRGDVWFSVLRR